VIVSMPAGRTGGPNEITGQTASHRRGVDVHAVSSARRRAGEGHEGREVDATLPFDAQQERERQKGAREETMCSA